MARIKRVQGVAAATPSETVEEDAATTQSTASTNTPAKQPRRRRRGRTSSERGRAFRKRQDNLEALLEVQVARLQQEIRDKQYLLSVCEAKYLRSRHSVHGPLVGIAVEYFRMFRFGSRPLDTFHASSRPERELAKRQQAFLHSVMDPDVVVAFDTHAARGPEAVLEQWRRSTLAAPDISIEIASQPVVIGPDDCPIVVAQLEGSCSVTPQCVDAICKLPAHAMAPHRLKKTMGKTMTVSIRVYLQFSPEKRIKMNIVQTDFVQSFVDLGLSLHDVAELFTCSSLSSEPPENSSESEEKGTSPARAY